MSESLRQQLKDDPDQILLTHLEGAVFTLLVNNQQNVGNKALAEHFGVSRGEIKRIRRSIGQKVTNFPSGF